MITDDDRRERDYTIYDRYRNNSDGTSKLVILVVGVSALALFAYFLYRERNRLQSLPQLQPQQLPQIAPLQTSGDLRLIEEKLMQLEMKIDRVTKTLNAHTRSSLQTTTSEYKKPKSLNPELQERRARSEIFDMK